MTDPAHPDALQDCAAQVQQSPSLEIKSDGKERLSLTLPEGWKAEIPETIKGTQTVFIQTSADSPQGKQTLKMKVGEGTVELVCNTVRKIK